MEEDDEIPFYQEEKDTDSFGNKLKRIATSSVLLVISYILSNLFLQILIARMSVLFGYTIRFSYNQVIVLPWDYHYWSRTHVVLIYFFSPFICFVLGMFIYNVLRVNTNWSSSFRLFFFWLSVCLANMVLAHALIAPLGSPDDRNNGLYQTFAVVGAYLWINPAIMVMASIASLVISVGLGMLVRNEVLRYSYSQKLIRTKKGMDIIAIQVYVVPVIVAVIPILMLCRQINLFTTIIQLANLATISIGIFLVNSVGMASIRCNKEDVLNHYPFVELGICASIWMSIFIFIK